MTFENVTILLKEFEYAITLRELLKEKSEVKKLTRRNLFFNKNRGNNEIL